MPWNYGHHPFVVCGSLAPAPYRDATLVFLYLISFWLYPLQAELSEYLFFFLTILGGSEFYYLENIIESSCFLKKVS